MMNSLMKQYKQFLEEVYLKNGDIVYISSDVFAMAKLFREHGEKLALEEVVQCITDIVGQQGTVIFPSYNWGFCQGIPFDVRKTESKTGALTKVALKQAGFARTSHPIYSMAVWGKDARYLKNLNTVEAFGNDSPFSYLHKNNAKCLAIGIGALEGLTLIHYIEQMVGVPYRYHKKFTAEYIDEHGKSELKTYSMYVRDLTMNPQHINGFEPLAQKMEKENLIISKNFKIVEHHLLFSKDLFKCVADDILANDSRLLYTYNHLQ